MLGVVSQAVNLPHARLELTRVQVTHKQVRQGLALYGKCVTFSHAIRCLVGSTCVSASHFSAPIAPAVHTHPHASSGPSLAHQDPHAPILRIHIPSHPQDPHSPITMAKQFEFLHHCLCCNVLCKGCVLGGQTKVEKSAPNTSYDRPTTTYSRMLEAL